MEGGEAHPAAGSLRAHAEEQDQEREKVEHIRCEAEDVHSELLPTPSDEDPLPSVSDSDVAID